jgi:hypothetical protein
MNAACSRFWHRESSELSHATPTKCRGLVRHSYGTRVRVFSLEQCVERAFPKLDQMALFPRLAASSAPASHGGTGLATVSSRLWYRAVLCDAVIGARQVPKLREHFADALGVAGWPDGACLFLSGRHAAAVFFSPAAIAVVPHLIAVCGAEPSPPPDRACATLLVGKQSDWELLPRGLH